ncbi:MAG: glycosyltransferase family 2 protein [Kouleothrix sp.]|nr:glycosyltransferase family 2 protein [Kouleothrix sp.]
MQRVDPILQSAPRNGAPRQTASPTFSIVGPVFNEEALLEEYCKRMIGVMESLGEPFELVLINDGSRDSSPEILRRIYEQDHRVKVINFSRNFGLQAALTAGLDHARGQAIIVMDTDLQDPPEVVPQLIAKWREGYQLVYAQRAERAGETWFKKVTASAFYRLITRITSVQIPVDTGEFRLLDRKVVDAIKQMREYNRFMRGLSVWVGYKQTGIVYERDARKAGETKFPLKKMVRLALDGITSFSYLPLQLATYLGFTVALFSLLGLVAVVVMRLTGQGDAFYGQASTLVSVLFLGGVQLIFLGIIGEYLGRIYDEVKRRPLYIVAEQLGFEERE